MRTFTATLLLAILTTAGCAPSHSTSDRQARFRERPGGYVREAHAPTPIEQVLSKAKQSPHVSTAGNSQHPCLTIGSSQIEWGLMSPSQKKGWLYFFKPDSSAEMWEFAPCLRTNLQDLVAGDLKAEYLRYGDQRIETVFGTDLKLKTLGAMTRPRSIIVREGQIVLARKLEPPHLVYAIKFLEQSGPQTGNYTDAELSSIRLAYLEVDPR
jgi:hypothetical protein